MECTVQALLQRHFSRFSATHKLARHQWRAAWALAHCRTWALGGHVRRCEHGHVDGVWYNSCRHRYCPQCNALAGERWLNAQRERLLACPHRHLVFTLPGDLRVLFRFNECVFTDAMFDAVRESLSTLLADARYLGATPGMILARHTWGRNLAYHPHIHCLVSEGGVDKAGAWRTPKRASILVPAKVVMQLYRGKLRAKLLALLDAGELNLPQDMSGESLRSTLNRLGRQPWHVYVGTRYSHGEGVAVYLARYMRGGPLRNTQLHHDRQGGVIVHYTRHRRDASGARRAKLRLSAEAFLGRYLAHVPVHRKRTVRSYGLYAPGCKARLDSARKSIGQPPTAAIAPIEWAAFITRHRPDAMRCRRCGGALRMAEAISHARGPP